MSPEPSPIVPATVDPVPELSESDHVFPFVPLKKKSSLSSRTLVSLPFLFFSDDHVREADNDKDCQTRVGACVYIFMR
jgi:hypothetical protein